MLFVLATALLALLVLSSTMVARSLGVPSPGAVALLLLLVAPVGLGAVLLGAALDRAFSERNAAKTTVAIVAWFAAVGAALVARHDLFGIRYLRDVAAAGSRSVEFSVGVITTEGLPSIAWTAAPLTPGFVAARLTLLGFLAVLAAAPAAVLRYRLSAAPAANAPSAAVCPPREVGPRPPVLAGAGEAAGLPVTIHTVIARWVARSKPVPALFAMGLLVAIVWYVDVFNPPPATRDVFGLWNSNVRALLFAAAAACATLGAVYAHGSRR